MSRTLQFLKDVGTFYVATVEGNQPRVRPFGAVALFKNRLYFSTSNSKDFYKQVQANPLVEISGTLGNQWIRLTGKLVLDTSAEAQKAVIEANPVLQKMYAVNDGKFAVFYVENGQSRFYAFGAKEPEVEKV